MYLYSKMVATPLVPFCIRKKGCLAGVCITASHNPKEDNGFKVYGPTGAQIVPPVDEYISAEIEANLAPWNGVVDTADDITASPLCEDPAGELIDSYFDEVSAKLCRYHATNAAPGAPEVIYTAMHGVGHEFAEAAFSAFNLPPFTPVAAQCDPDPTFPTVKFPNPEEGEGALQMAFDTASPASDGTIVLANDPDADRLAAAVRVHDPNWNSEWRIFTGNEIGTLLGHWQWSNWKRENPQGDPSSVHMLASTVSSKMLQKIAHVEGFNFEETLTGFKWMGNRAEEICNMSSRDQVLLCYEAEIGYCVGDIVRDKDGVSAAAVFAEMAAYLKREHGLTVHQHYEKLCEKYGHFVGKITTLSARPSRRSTPYLIAFVPGASIGGVGPHKIASIRDLRPGSEYDSTMPDGKPKMPSVPQGSEMITYTFEDGGVVTLRTGGTEPD